MDPQGQKKKKQQKTEEHKEQSADKTYIKSKKKWKDFNIDQSIIEALRRQNKTKPTKVQQESLEIALDPSRKKFNLLIRAINGSGKTLAFLLPMIMALKPGVKCVEDKVVRGKTIQNQVFKPQGIIIIQNFLLQSQLNQYLSNFRDYGENQKVERLQFTVGVLNNDGHKFGDIIVCIAKSFLNRHSRGNMKLDNCKFVAIDEIDQLYNFDKQSLANILKIVKQSNSNLISCSATMEKHFLNFYHDIDKDYITLNLNAQLEKQTGHKITLQGVQNLSKIIECEKKQDKTPIYNFILKDLFKQIYNPDVVQKKAQIFIFFNSIDQIYQFDKKYQALASDFTKEESKYLEHVTRAAVASKMYKDGQKVDMGHKQKQAILTKFKNGETNVLMCTNIMARGIDIRNAVFVINVGAPRKSDKQNDIDVDIYLHRVGRTGRHNDKGIALTIGVADQIDSLTSGVKKIHKIDIVKAEDSKKIANQIYKCIESNS